ncbi:MULTISPECIES: hypothetical protein [unclassified Cytobacillus]|uniref:hypothetical protein n=1 Tax=unclassified Cytobacillus TaxID=2675268 RepID=UPI00135BC4B2|nr:hypothetical protein [Cytobacillus sp. AMY 15.2]KAF0817209.1 hypothetical protein KIS4809_3904 [Bacillus sp. ZZV12-4809]MCM3094106.1 hypothetical protein [Cytobacillus sp. AMY 15.2]
MIKHKISAAITIFALLFAGAWILDHQTKREFYIPVDEEVVELLPAENQVEAGNERNLKVFEPREYVRIQAAS